MLLIDADSLSFVASKASSKKEAIIFFNEKINTIVENTRDNELIFFSSPPKTFRNKIVTYKAQRKPVTNNYIKFLRNYIKNKSVYVENVEADDLVVLSKLYLFPDATICALDKDVLNSIEGEHYNYHFKKNCFIYVSKEDTYRFKAFQLLVGDSVDNIKGIPGIGKVKANNLLNKWEQENKSFCYQIMRLYLTHLSKEQFRENISLLSMLSSEDELIHYTGITFDDLKKLIIKKRIVWK